MAIDYLFSHNKYGQYCIPSTSRHRPAAKAVLAHTVYEPNTIEFIAANCGNGSIVHAGTYFGDVLPALSRCLSNKARVWAFEPNIENYRSARITLTMNDIENVSLTNAGLGANDGILYLQTVDDTGASLGGASHIVGAQKKETGLTKAVQIASIDDSVDPQENVSIIQLDIEGYEKEPLSGALKTIHSHHPILILEVLPTSTLQSSDWFAENILSLGYRKTGELHNNSVFTCTLLIGFICSN